MHASGKKGQLSLIIFESSLPKNGVQIRISGKGDYESDRHGQLLLDLDEGEHQVEFFNQNKWQKFHVRVGSSQSTQVIINILDENFHLDMQQPPKKKFSKSNEVQLGQGKISGTLKDISKNHPVEDARIFVKGIEAEVRSDSDGGFEINLAPGNYTISIIHQKYSTEIKSNVKVEKNKTTQLNFQLTLSGFELEDLVVLSPSNKGSVSSLIEIRRKSSSVSDLIGSEQMSRTGDSDAGNSLKRVTGLSLLGGKYIYVRGLGERYSSTLLNESQVPSPEQSRRVVPMDLFPSGMIESIAVQKSYSPDMPAEFGGGVVKIKTKSIPKKFFFRLGVSTTYIDQKKKLTYQGGSKDWMGKDDGIRSLPIQIAEATSNGKILKENNSIEKRGYGRAKLAELGKSFQNIYNVKQRENGYVPNISTSFGNFHQFGPFRLGYISSGLYTQSWNENFEQRFTYNAESRDRLVENSRFDLEESARTIKVAGMQGLGLMLGKNHRLNFNALVLRKSTDKARIKSGADSEDQRVRNTSLEWVERELKAGQVQGFHRFGFFIDLEIDWSYTYSKANQYAPDRREYRYVEDEKGVLRFDGISRGDANQRIYSQLTDRTRDYATNLKVPFKLLRQNGFVKLGAKRLERNRVSSIRRFKMAYQSNSSQDLSVDSSKDLEAIFANCIRPDCFLPQESTRATDNYDAAQKQKAYYGMINLPVTKYIDLHSGVRYEYSLQNVKSFELFTAEPEVNYSRLLTRDYFPSFGVTLNFTDKLKLRAAYSETISRPDFRELSATEWTDDDKGYEVKGNPDLLATIIKNKDIRLEWFFGKKEIISFGVFQKELEKPIEETFLPGTELKSTHNNAQTATNRGFEIELRKNMGFVWNWLKAFSVIANYSRIESEVVLSESDRAIQTSPQRPLQGQSPYVLNLQLEFDDENLGSKANISFNRIGKRITGIGTGGRPDIKELPYNQLDFNYSQKLTSYAGLNFKAKNILESKTIFKQSEEITRIKKNEISLSAGLKVHF